MLRFLTLFVCLLGAQQYVKAQSCHMREVDLCLATVLIAASDGVPLNDDDMDRACEPIKEGFECMGNYSSKCFTPLLQEIYNAIAGEAEKGQSQVCTRGTELRARYLKNAPCIQSVMGNDNVRPHINDMLTVLEKALEAKFDQRVPMLCCGLQRLSSTILALVKEECGQEVIDEGSAFLGMPIDSISNMFCRGYETGSEKCKGLLPPPGTPFSGVDSDNQLIRFIASAMESLP